MISVSKEFTFDYAHRLILDYESPCSNIHGHTGKIKITLSDNILYEPQNDILLNFVNFKEIIDMFKSLFDHALILNSKDRMLHNVLGAAKIKHIVLENHNPTSETFCKMLWKMAFKYLSEHFMTNDRYDNIISNNAVIKIEFWETPTSVATFIKPVAEDMMISPVRYTVYDFCDKPKKDSHECSCGNNCKCNNENNEAPDLIVIHKNRRVSNSGTSVVADILRLRRQSRPDNVSEEDNETTTKEKKETSSSKEPKSTANKKSSRPSKPKNSRWVNSILRSAF